MATAPKPQPRHGPEPTRPAEATTIATRDPFLRKKQIIKVVPAHATPRPRPQA